MKRGRVQKETLWLLKTIWEDDFYLFRIGLTIIMDELERLIQSEPEAKEMHSSHIAYLLSDLSILDEALRQLRIYQPWVQTFLNSLIDKEEGIMQNFAHKTRNWGIVKATMEGLSQTQIVRLGKPEGGKFH